MIWKAVNSSVTRALKSALEKTFAKVLDSISKACLREEEEEVNINTTPGHWS